MLPGILPLLLACQFTLGFAALHAQLPEVVGDCVQAVAYSETGDALQSTTNGLLVWRKSDNWTAFTDGAETWINGPLGLEQRPNTTRLPWEANPQHLPIFPAPQPGDRCHTAGLDLSLKGVEAGAGNLVGTFEFTNTQDLACMFFGYPGAQLLDDAGANLPTQVIRGGGYFSADPPPTQVDVPAHAGALFRIHWEQVPVGNEPGCPLASRLAVTPPDEYVSIEVAVQIRACGGGTLNVSRVQSE